MDEDEKSDRCLPELSSGKTESPYVGLRPPSSLETDLILPRELLHEALTELKTRSAGWPVV
jgi:hypothetical protein